MTAGGVEKGYASRTCQDIVLPRLELVRSANGIEGLLSGLESTAIASALRYATIWAPDFRTDDTCCSNTVYIPSPRVAWA